MSIYYYEGEIISAPFSIVSNEPMDVSDSLSLKQNRHSQGAQRWELSFSIMTNGSEGDHLANLLVNQALPKTMVMPQLLGVERKSSAPAPIDILCSTTFAAGVSTVGVNEAGYIFKLAKGAFIKFSNHSKIYMLTAAYDSTVDSSISFYPNLRTGVANTTHINTHLSVTKPVLSFYRSKENLPSIDYTDGVLVSLSNIRLLEAL